MELKEYMTVISDRLAGLIIRGGTVRQHIVVIDSEIKFMEGVPISERMPREKVTAIIRELLAAGAECVIQISEAYVKRYSKDDAMSMEKARTLHDVKSIPGRVECLILHGVTTDCELILMREISADRKSVLPGEFVGGQGGRFEGRMVVHPDRQVH